MHLGENFLKGIKRNMGCSVTHYINLEKSRLQLRLALDRIVNPNNCLQLPTGPCESITSSNQEHVNNTRAYTTTEMVGQTCWGTFCYGGTEQTVYKAQGSDDEIGTEASTQTTLFADPNGNYYLQDPETCPVELENSNYNGWAYYHNDHLGTPRIVTDANGTELWKGDYTPFGKVKETTPEGVTFQQDIRFPGQVEDSETGFYYNYNRYYDPSLGRYTTSDPIGLNGGINTYAYVGGNPLMHIDPIGLSYAPTADGFLEGASNSGTSSSSSSSSGVGSTLGRLAFRTAAGRAGWMLSPSPLGASTLTPEQLAARDDFYEQAREEAREKAMQYVSDDIRCEGGEEDDLEKICEKQLEISLVTCRALGRRNGKDAYKICESQAMERYADCLSERNMNPPLPPWN